MTGLIKRKIFDKNLPKLTCSWTNHLLPPGRDLSGPSAWGTTFLMPGPYYVATVATSAEDFIGTIAKNDCPVAPTRQTHFFFNFVAHFQYSRSRKPENQRSHHAIPLTRPKLKFFPYPLRIRYSLSLSRAEEQHRKLALVIALYSLFGFQRPMTVTVFMLSVYQIHYSCQA